MPPAPGVVHGIVPRLGVKQNKQTCKHESYQCRNVTYNHFSVGNLVLGDWRETVDCPGNVVVITMVSQWLTGKVGHIWPT